MSRADLDHLQVQLKAAIQNHQMLVAKIKQESQNAALKGQLHDIQNEITILSEKQKILVQKLRKDLIADRENRNTPSPIAIQPKPAVPVQQNTSDVHPTDLSLKTQVSNIQSAKTELCLPPSEIINKSDVPRNANSPPIRVPQYTAHKPSILQGSKQTSFKNQVLQPGMESSSVSHSYSDNHFRDIRKTVEKKQVSPEEKMKLEFMACIDLVTPDTLKELQSKRTERKRRSTANPQFTYGFELDFFLQRKPRLANHFDNPQGPGIKRGRGRPPKNGRSPGSSRPSTPDSSSSNSTDKADIPNGSAKVHDDVCSVCGTSGQLLPCDRCNKVYHTHCIDPPLTSLPESSWSCHKCQGSKKSTWSLEAVNNYIANKTAREEERKKLLKRGAELLNEKNQLESRSQQLNDSIAQQTKKKQEMLGINKQAQASVENLKNFIKVVQS
ncbi:hypothetical protein ACJMK2_021181 [Sinanodonta woodiana]|uniref:PHD-type domain-containing protein n=1 Tax=Sinanodonta woodiana TaxID=1069815 RepID=A0ABD3U1B5_SINWO